MSTKIKKANYVDVEDANAVPIVDVAELLGLTLIKSGASYFIPCPNHIEKKHDNCSISPKRNIFKCFVCGCKGGSVKLVMDTKNCEFKEALQFIGENFGLCKELEFEIEGKRGWNGLTQAEYDLFGLKNVFVEDVINTEEDDNGELQLLYSKSKYSLRDLAKEDPECHDTLLLNKFSEKVYSLLVGYEVIEKGNAKISSTIYQEPNKSILLGQILNEIKEYKKLLKKGLMNIERYLEVCELDKEKAG